MLLRSLEQAPQSRAAELLEGEQARVALAYVFDDVDVKVRISSRLVDLRTSSQRP
jgi:hypothetical protein